MSIIGKFKRLIFGARAEPMVQVPMRTVPQPEQAQSSKAGDNESRFSESDILAVKQRAETVTLAFNEALSIANQSKDRGTREYKLQIAREWLIELKKLANKFPFLHLENVSAVEARIIAVEAETRSLPYNEVLIRYVADNVDSSVTSASCWVKPGTEIIAKGLTIPGGMLYYGKGLARVTGAGIEPALINPGLPATMPAGSLEQMPYWLSYSDISPTARGGYLQWLASGRKDPNVQIGYVFLFFYGLERRVLADARQYPEVAQELPAVLAEVRRLLSIYENQGSFYGYASRFLDLVVTVGAKDRIYKLPPLPQGQNKALTLRHKIALGQAAVDGALLLLAKGWYEPPRISGMHLSTLIQQLLSLVAQYGGATAAQAWSVLCESGVFPGVTKEEFAELLRGLGEKDILMQDSTGLLLHGGLGEKLVNHYTFYAAFTSDEEFRIVSGGKTLGSVPVSRPLEVGSYVIFAGRRWQVMGFHPTEKLIEVVPAKGGKPPLFDGMVGKVHDRVRAEMRAVLSDTTPVSFLDKQAVELLAEARSAYARFNLDNESVIQFGNEARIFTWCGDWVNDTLSLMLAKKDVKATNEGLCLVVFNAERDRLRDLLYDIVNDNPPKPEDLARLIQNKAREKWDGLLTEELLCKSFASSELDVPGAIAAANLAACGIINPRVHGDETPR